MDWAAALAAALIVYLIVHNFVFTVSSVFGNSMEPTLSHGDKLILSPLPYFFSKPEVGDVIAFPYGEDEYFTKRIMAKEGDVIELIDDVLYINGAPVYDEYSGMTTYNHGNIEYPLTVPKDSYFVMGDNKNASMDSRFSEVGCISSSHVKGKVIFRVYPFDKFGGIH